MIQRPKALFCDVDRTLLTHGHVLLPVVAAAVGRAVLGGIQVILASARSPASLRPLCADLGLRGPAVCFNGAWVGDLQQAAPAEELRLAPADAQAVAQCAAEAGLAVMWYDEAGVHAPETFAETARRQAAVTGDPLVLVPALKDLPGAPFKLMVVAPPDALPDALSQLRARTGARAAILPSGPGLIEVVHRDANKARGAARIAAGLRLGPADCAAVGDGGNDLDLLRWAGLPLTVANGTPDLRALARFTGGHCDTGGLADVIDWLLHLPAAPPR